MISKFGEVLRDIRKETKESLRTMAKRLDISPAFLSIMEVGRKKIPADYASKINDVYHLDNKTFIKLSNSIIETNNHVDINIKEMNDAQKEVSMIFARKIIDADSDLVNKLKKALEESDK